MARITKIEVTPAYAAVVGAAATKGEDNDCAVRAISILSGLEYDTVHNAFIAAGREVGKPTPWTVITTACAALGVTLKEVKAERTDPVRFPKAWADQPAVMMDTGAHVAAFKDGQLHDWSVNRAMRVKKLWTVTVGKAAVAPAPTADKAPAPTVETPAPEADAAPAPVKAPRKARPVKVTTEATVEAELTA
jgi:hypothetical protein